MKAQLIFEIEEGNTLCNECPFNMFNKEEVSCTELTKGLNCEKYNLATLKFKKEYHDTNDTHQCR